MKNPIEYLDGMINFLFIKSKDKTVFFPMFLFGSGYIVDSKEQEEEIRSFLRKFYVITVGGGLLVGFLLAPFILALMLGGVGAWYYYQTNQMTNDLKKSSERLTIDEKVNEIANAYDLKELIVIAALMIGFLLIGFIMIWKGGLISRFIGFALMVVFGAKTYFFEMVIRRKLAADPSLKKDIFSPEKLVEKAKAEMSKVATKVTDVMKASEEVSKKTAIKVKKTLEEKVAPGLKKADQNTKKATPAKKVKKASGAVKAKKSPQKK